MNESYAALNFGKPLAEIDKDDLIRFFGTEREETDTVEFKSYYEKGQDNHKHKEAGVLKTICAFLNSSGSMVIWGAPVGHTPEGRKTKVFTGDLSPVPQLIEKDTFISKVANTIVPLSNLVKMHRVEIEPGNYVYVFDVQESLHKPHQFDNRYWVRSDGQSNIAPHYLIDALFKQVRYPNLGGYIKFGMCGLFQRNVLDLNLTILMFNHSKEQNEYDLYYSLMISDGAIVKETSLGVFESNNTLYRRDEVTRILSYSHNPYQEITLRIPYQKLVNPINQNERYPLSIMLTFGGKLSPMKESEYTLTFRDFNGFGPTHPRPIEKIFTIEKKVNMPRVASGLSEEERVNYFLSQ